MYPNSLKFSLPASWLSSNAFGSAAGGLKFKYRAYQIERSLDNDSPQLQHFFEMSCVAHSHRMMGTVTLFGVVRSITASWYL